MNKLSIVLCLVIVQAVRSLGFANTVLESATLGQTGKNDFGYTVASFQFLGARFHISETTLVDHVGGHLFLANNFGSNELVFGAIAPIGSGPHGFPLASPASFQPLAETNLTVPEFSADLLVPLSVTLQPGDYALIFGAGRFGAGAIAAMPTDNTDTAQADYFIQDENTWQDDDPLVKNLRFVVNGSVVPEPSTLALAALGFIGLAAWRLRRR